LVPHPHFKKPGHTTGDCWWLRGKVLAPGEAEKEAGGMQHCSGSLLTTEPLYVTGKGTWWMVSRASPASTLLRPHPGSCCPSPHALHAVVPWCAWN